MKKTEFNEADVEVLKYVLKEYIETAECVESAVGDANITEDTFDAYFDAHPHAKAVKLWLELGNEYKTYTSYKVWKRDVFRYDTPFLD
jgi:hypothetical protein